MVFTLGALLTAKMLYEYLLSLLGSSLNFKGKFLENVRILRILSLGATLCTRNLYGYSLRCESEISGGQHGLAWVCMLLREDIYDALHDLKVVIEMKHICMLCDLHCTLLRTVTFLCRILFSRFNSCIFCVCSSSSGGEKRHKRRRHEKSLDRETSL